MRKFIAAASVFLLLAASAAQARVFSKSATGKPDLKSINVISFAPEGVLLVGDGSGSAVFAIQTGDDTPQGT